MADFTPQGDMNLRDTYAISGVISMNATTFYGDGSNLSGVGNAEITVAANDSPATSKLVANYLCDGTDDDVQIQAALDALPVEGGDVKLLEGTFVISSTIIPIKDGFNLSGLGRGTIIKLKDSGNTSLIKMNNGITDWVIRDIRFDGNKANQSAADQPLIYINNTSSNSLHSKMGNIWVENSKGVGIYAVNPRRCHIFQSIIQNNDSHGVHITAEHLEMYGCRIQYNGGDGLHADDMYDNIISGCQIQYNTGHGISLVKNSVVANSNIMVNDGFGIAEVKSARINGCGIRWNRQTGIKVRYYSTVVGCSIGDNSYNDSGSYDNVEIYDGWYTTISGNQIGYSSDNARYDINITSAPAIAVPLIIGNSFRKPTTAILNTVTEIYMWKNNTVNDPVFDQDIKLYKNTSGGSLAVGDTVVLKSVASGSEMTITTNQGDDKVLGMITATINNNAMGRVLVVGKTTKLKVNGSVDIAIGDFIGTFTTEKIGMKAAAGDMAYAIALEAYTADNSSGVIDALLITPRKI